MPAFQALGRGTAPRPRPCRLAHPLIAGALALLLAACGGGGGGGVEGGATGTDPVAVPQVVEKPATRAEAARFLTQATFGPVDADVDRVMSVGYAAWIDEQWTRPWTSHRATWEAADAASRAAGEGGVWQNGVLNAFWKEALSGPAQLRQRVAYALSQIFVISMQGSAVGSEPRAVAAWFDMLGQHADGRYRDLLQAVSLHPQMGVYLSHLKNRKADATTGRVPDENYAREVMQLFSIGLVQLNPDGTPRLEGGQPVETYGPADIAGLAKVFTGYSWDCASWPDNDCFHWGGPGASADRHWKPMAGYPQYHSAEEKQFLGVTMPAQTRADPDASLKLALDTLAAHPNVAPFIGRQLIQRLVTSNPSPSYVRAVAGAFTASGGHLGVTVKAVLMHPEARRMSNTDGKLREPVLKLSAFLRAFGYMSDSGDWRVGLTDGDADTLGQSPLRAPSVFNFYRPGYVPPGTATAAAGLVAPELQIAHESSAAGYVNYMRDVLNSGAGSWSSLTQRRDLQADLAAELALVEQPALLVQRINDRLMYGSMPAALAAEIEAAVASIAIPALNSTGSNQASIDRAKRNRVRAALFLALVSPEFSVQK